MIRALGARGLLTRTITPLAKSGGTAAFTKTKLPLNAVDLDRYSQAQPHEDDEIIIAMSSGVDLSVAASIFAGKYKNVRGIYMANWTQSAKCLEDEWNDVQRVCKQLDIPCERVNFEKEYWSDVFVPMIEMYKQGLTPNPDVGCNKFVKFGKMVEHLHDKYESSSMIKTKNWWLVTGHYARIMKDAKDNKFHLLRGYYPYKDQSYYLLMMPKDILSKILMPIGHLTKPEVREIAELRGLSTAKKPDSQGLCFVGQDQTKFTDFLGEFIDPKKGHFITKDEGLIVGEHTGIWLATIGQRARVCMPQGDPKYKGQWFVSGKKIDTNELVIVKGANHPALYSSVLSVESWELLDPELDITSLQDLTVQYRSLQDPPCIVKNVTTKGKGLEIELMDKARALAPGQYIVLYQGSRVLGAGVLTDTK